MDLVFAYLAGLLTLINPCVLPVLPIVLASALQVSPLGPVVLATGMGLSFVAVGMAVLSFGQRKLRQVLGWFPHLSLVIEYDFCTVLVNKKTD